VSATAMAWRFAHRAGARYEYRDRLDSGLV